MSGPRILALMGAVINLSGSFAWAFIAFTICEVIVLLLMLVLACDTSPAAAIDLARPASAR